MITLLQHLSLLISIIREPHDIAIALSSSNADPGLRGAFKGLNQCPCPGCLDGGLKMYNVFCHKQSGGHGGESQ